VAIGWALGRRCAEANGNDNLRRLLDSSSKADETSEESVRTNTIRRNPAAMQNEGFRRLALVP
jgi:hypothetical protein